MRYTLSVFGMAALLALGGCSSDSTTGGTPPPPPPPPPAPPPAADVVIVVDNIAFIDPDGNVNEDFVLTITSEQTIRFDNEDNVDHTVTSSDEPAGAPSFDEPLDVGQSALIGPLAEGTWTFFCELHPGIMFDATIIVNAP